MDAVGGGGSVKPEMTPSYLTAEADDVSGGGSGRGRRACHKEI